MNIGIRTRRKVTNEPVFVKAENVGEDIASAKTEDGEIYPAQSKDDGIVVVGDFDRREKDLELSSEKAEGGVEIKYADDHKALDVYINSKLFTSYVFDRGLVKPYLGPIYNDAGSSYTRLDLSIKEHPHQRSVYFAVGNINGIDFWNENTVERGEQHHKEFESIKSGSAYGSFTAKNVWTSHLGEPIIDEKRTYTFYNQKEDLRYVDAETTFTASYCDIKFGKTKEAGPLGIRVNPQMTGEKTGIIRNSYGAITESECWGRAASWCDYTGQIDGQTYGITVFDNEDNERYPTTWHIRDYGLFAANNLFFKGGFDLPKGQSITYKFRICFHKGEFDAQNRFLVYAK